jgi:ABC-type spermidine/putrescine transport system permease subunit II
MQQRREETTIEEELRLKIPILRLIFWFLIFAVGIVTVLPSLYLLVWAFWGTDTVGIISNNFTLRWLLKILASSEWRESLIYSFGIAILVSFISCMVLTIHFYFMRYVSPLIEGISYLFTIIPIILPGVIYALALRILGADIKLPEMMLLGIGHLVFVIPIQYFLFETAQEKIPSTMLFAGSTLGASPSKNIIFVYIPMILSTIRGAFLVGFFFSLDEIIIAAFVLDSPLVTIPKRLWDQIHRSMEPSPAAVACLIFLIFILLMIGAVTWSFIRKKYRQ